MFRPLRLEAATKLLGQARRALGIDDAGHEQALRGFTALTADDFAAAMRQTRFRWVKDLADLVERLRHETRFKLGAGARSIGFVA